MAARPHPAHTVRQTFRGAISGVQSVSFGFSYRYDNPGTIPAARDVADSLADPTSGMHPFENTLLADMSSQIGSNLHWSSVLYQVYGENPAVPAENMYALNVTGGGAVRMPPEVACVVSLRTAVSSRSTRGRAFLPLQAIELDATNGMFVLSACGTVATAVQTFLRAVNAHAFQESGGSLGFSLTACVVSTTHQSTQDITGIRVDTKPDVQRKREHHIPYQTFTANI